MNPDLLESDLRREAQEMKDAFTRYALQTFSITTVALALLARFQKDDPALGLSGVSITILSLAIARVGVYAYTNANRLYGYQLFRARLSRMGRLSTDISSSAAEKLPWEEAMRAWRIVQPTIFETYYQTTGNWFVNAIGRANAVHTDMKAKENWYEIPKLIHPDAKYYAGSYLRTMLNVFKIIVLIACCAVFYMAYQHCVDPHLSPGRKWTYVSLSGLLGVALSIVAFARIRQLQVRRLMIEEGILSIHSCSLMWHLTIVAHFRAMLSLGATGSLYEVEKLEGYTEALSIQALLLREHLENSGSIGDWYS